MLSTAPLASGVSTLGASCLAGLSSSQLWLRAPTRVNGRRLPWAGDLGLGDRLVVHADRVSVVSRIAWPTSARLAPAETGALPHGNQSRSEGSRSAARSPCQQHVRLPGGPGAAEAMDEALATSWANTSAAACLTLPSATEQVACSAQQLNITAPPRRVALADEVHKVPALSCLLTDQP